MVHVKRHLNRLFGSFRNSSTSAKNKDKKESQSRWELFESKENLKLDQGQGVGDTVQESFVQPELQSSMGGEVDGAFKDKDVAKTRAVANLLKRTWSRRKKKEKLENDEDAWIADEQANLKVEDLSSVVDEINATIGMINAFKQIHSEDEAAPTFLKNSSEEEVLTASSSTDEFDSVDLQNTETIIQAFEEKAINLEKCLEGEQSIPKMETEMSHARAFKRSRSFKNSSVRLYTNFRRSRSLSYRIKTLEAYKCKQQNPEDHEVTEISTPKANRNANWVTRSFRRVLRRKAKSVQDLPSETSNMKFKDSNNATQIAKKRKGTVMGRVLNAFGKSMIDASAVMPLPCEHPYSDRNNGLYPTAYFEDEDAIYEFRKYCEAHRAKKMEQNGEIRTFQRGILM